MKQLLLILVMPFVLISCGNATEEKEVKTEACTFQDPVKELSWLNDVKNSLSRNYQVSIFQAVYQNQTVFYTRITDPAYNTVFSISLCNCEGKIIKSYTQNDQIQFTKEVTGAKVLYRSNEGK
jgi:hypothetical protein